MGKILLAQNVEKKFGFFSALTHISFSLDSPSIVGFIGPNGSGKTTLLKIFATLLPPTSGKVAILGKDISRESEQIRREISVLFHHPGFYEELTGKENLCLFFRILRGRADSPDVEEALEWAGLNRRADAPVRTYSRGMKQKLALARALFLPAQLFLLDEPFTALDDDGIARTSSRFLHLLQQGKTILFTAHRWIHSPLLPVHLYHLENGRISHSE
ncbi:MAG: heme ABC exporter ATP-binding protein CcmA [bacterium]